MTVSKILLAVGCAMAVSAAASASVRETFTLSGLPSEGTTPTSPSAGSGMFTSLGGYSLGRIDFSGTLVSTGIGSYGSESRVRIQSPLGGFLELQPFPSATDVFTSLSFTGSMFISFGSNPVGAWSVRTFESFDDSGGVDANWSSMEFRFTDEPPVAPSAIDLGSLASGRTTASGSVDASNRVRWYKFTTVADATAAMSTYLDVDTEGSAFLPTNDTEIALYTSTGVLVGTDDDDGSGLLSQLTYGAGTRPAAPPTGGGTLGSVYDGRDGALAAGTYYLAIASFNSVFSDGFTVTAGTSYTGNFNININTNAVPAPGTLALLAAGGLIARRRRA